MGNASYSLNRFGVAYQYYSERLEMNIPFDNPDTEIQFYYRLGRSAFQENNNEQSISACEKALSLINSRIHPGLLSDLLTTEFDKT